MRYSFCPECGGRNHKRKNRKHKFSVWGLLGFYIPFYSKELVEFKFIRCGSCGAEYKDDTIKIFGFSSVQEKLFIVFVAVLFAIMIMTAW